MQRHTSDGLHLQTPHLISVKEGYVKMEQSQEERCFTGWCQSGVSPGQFPLHKTSEVKMLSVCQLHHTLLLFPLLLYIMLSLWPSNISVHLEMCGYHLSQ